MIIKTILNSKWFIFGLVSDSELLSPVATMSSKLHSNVPMVKGSILNQSIALWAAGLGLENGQYLLRMKGWLSKQTTVSIRGTLWCNRSGTMATCCPELWAKSVPSMHPIFSSWILVSMSQTRIGNTGLCCQRECFGLKVDAVPLWQTGQEREKTRFHIALELKGNPQNRRCCAICSNW